MRKIETHLCSGLSKQLRLSAGEAGAGGASYDYMAEGSAGWAWLFRFQNGLVPEVGLNGVTNEVLLAIVHDRLKGFQAGDFPCRENADAIAAIEVALGCLHERTSKRLAAGVEGKNEALPR